MQERLKFVVIKLCENLPLDITLFERNGECYKPNEVCQYCRKNGKDSSLCYKKTYIAYQNFKTA